MKPTIQSVRFDADKKLVAFIEERIQKLDTFYEGIIGSEVILKLEKSDDNANKLAEIKIKISGNELFAKKQCASFEEAVDTAIDALKTQLKKQKEKRNQAKY
ncbi:MAG: ribosome hibernation-promoting factor, HPF/YfiA family [Bacteroidota bacterium]|jgi:putative sigma-54 modulation protein